MEGVDIGPARRRAQRHPRQERGRARGRPRSASTWRRTGPATRSPRAGSWSSARVNVSSRSKTRLTLPTPRGFDTVRIMGTPTPEQLDIAPDRHRDRARHRGSGGRGRHARRHLAGGHRPRRREFRCDDRGPVPDRAGHPADRGRPVPGEGRRRRAGPGDRGRLPRGPLDDGLQRGPHRARRQGGPVQPDGPGRAGHRPLARHGAARRGRRVDVRGRGVLRPVSDLARRGHQEDRRRAGPAGPRQRPGRGRELLLNQAATGVPAAERGRSPARRRPCATRADPAVRPGLPRARPDRRAVAASGAPARDQSQELPIWCDRQRALFSAWYEFFPRSEGAVVDRRHARSGTARSRPRRRGCRVADAGLRRGLPAADPPDRPGQP